jgi:TRAP-type C4-dicarboxylate transport system substrate-binding protein
LPEQRKVFRAADSEILGQLKSKGVVVTNADPKPFADAAKVVWDTFAGDVGGRAQIDAVLNTK